MTQHEHERCYATTLAAAKVERGDPEDSAERQVSIVGACGGAAGFRAVSETSTDTRVHQYTRAAEKLTMSKAASDEAARTPPRYLSAARHDASFRTNMPTHAGTHRKSPAYTQHP